jgi:preprotein translocase subunit SecD
VAEPVIQSAGGNRILIQLPGLSQADKDSAKANKSEDGVPGIPHGA